MSDKEKVQQILTKYTISELVEYHIKAIDRINKAIEYITSYESIDIIQQNEHLENNKDLDEKTMIEMVRRYMIIHDKLLEILDKGSESNA